MGKVVIVGSINQDIVVTAERHPRPGETLVGSALDYFPGGKGANQAVAAARSGADTHIVGSVGADDFGRSLLTHLTDSGVDVSSVSTAADQATGVALITVDAAGENTIVGVSGANASVQWPADQLLVAPDVLVSQFEVPVPTITAFFIAGRAVGATTVLNPAPAKLIDSDLLALVDILVVNEHELSLLAAVEVPKHADSSVIAEVAARIGVHNGSSVIVTTGPDGAVIVTGDDVVVVEGRQVNAVDTTGAGDCFVGNLAAQLANGVTLAAAGRFANVAASLCVQVAGAGSSMPTSAQVEAVLTHDGAD